MAQLTKKYKSSKAAFFLFIASTLLSACTTTKDTSSGALVIQQQGSFAVGGTVITNPGTFDPIKHGAYNPVSQPSEGQTLHGDHAYVFYQIPKSARKLPLVFWHGHGQSAKTWETTPDGRGIRISSCGGVSRCI